MRQRWEALKAALREFARPTWEHEEDPDIEAQVAARTAWIREHRPDDRR